jgi:hypothetical protein
MRERALAGHTVHVLYRTCQCNEHDAGYIGGPKYHVRTFERSSGSSLACLDALQGLPAQCAYDQGLSCVAGYIGAPNTTFAPSKGAVAAH